MVLVLILVLVGDCGQLPPLSVSAVLGPDLDVGSIFDYTIRDVKDVAVVARGGNDIGTVRGREEFPALSTTAVVGVKLDVSTSVGAGVSEVKGATRHDVADVVIVSG